MNGHPVSQSNTLSDQMGYPVLEVAEVAGLRGHHHRVSGRDHVWMSLGIGHRALGDPRQPGRGAPRDL